MSVVSVLDLPVEGNLPSLAGATGWLNSQPQAPADLQGKVVLVEFWTYTCINWLRTLPYVRAWAEKYERHGLIVIGVHTPEFSFEQDVENVRRAAGEMRIDYPIAIDSDYAIWQAFENSYWPALYFADLQGRIRHHHFGEGKYEHSEAVIQQLLSGAGAEGIDRELVSVAGRGPEAAADWESLESPETYLGYRLAEQFASPGGAVPNESNVYAFPDRLGRNEWALAGDWTVGRETAVLDAADGRIAFRFHARDLHLVTGAPERAVPFRVLIDGEPPGVAHGGDIDEQGEGTVAEQRLYQLIRQPAPVAERTLEIVFSGPGVRLYAFTFG